MVKVHRNIVQWRENGLIAVAVDATALSRKESKTAVVHFQIILGCEMRLSSHNRRRKPSPQKEEIAMDHRLFLAVRPFQFALG